MIDPCVRSLYFCFLYQHLKLIDKNDKTAFFTHISGIDGKLIIRDSFRPGNMNDFLMKYGQIK